ncbi:ABC transporter permease [Picrophilus oshimae]|uniref:ABC-2 type transport system permease protein n=1 Tax=Picrophilus torridus (strain ATCC 700027 / DSM 9790 / JCM 10055 / NBRC 100828 / KAW 2/3) TaxID=1122961 RepID=A0A8G2FW76_PICTO|nr:ABC transporter permease [Picrophilus oshimae]SMD30635.1 ABC-2 type transport system permease protein [Picrophilus oshimae DSM 9789]
MSFSQYLTSLKYQLLFYIRSRRFIGLLGIAIAISLIFTVLDIHFDYSLLKSGTDSSFLYGYLSSFIIFLTSIVAAFFGGDLISIDTGTQSAYYSMVQPVPRSIIVLGRYTAAVISTFIILLSYVLIGLGGSYYLYGSIPSKSYLVILILLLFSAAFVAFATFFSALFKTPLTGMIITILLVIIVFPIIQDVVSDFVGYAPYMFITFGGEIVYLVLLSKYSTKSVSTIHGIKMYSFLPSFYEGIIILALYLVIFTALAIILYKYKEVKG